MYAEHTKLRYNHTRMGMKMSDFNMQSCRLCPRNCNINRTLGQAGVCGMTKEVRIARAALHAWEEPCISGEQGSGTVFFSGCNLHCVYCQNVSIAAGKKGNIVSIEELAQHFLRLQEQGAHNINLVTPSHYVPQIKEALLLAKEQGLVLPIVYNTSSYEKPEALRLLAGEVDIYLADIKYTDMELAKKYSHAEDYFLVAMSALQEMVRQVGEARFVWPGEQTEYAEYEDGMLMKRGVIVRHLLLPGCLADSKRVVRYVYETYGDSVYLSLMNQYTPLPHVGTYPELNRKVTEEEYEELVDYAIDLGVSHGFIQEGDTADESFIPDFERSTSNPPF